MGHRAAVGAENAPNLRLENTETSSEISIGNARFSGGCADLPLGMEVIDTQSNHLHVLPKVNGLLMNLSSE